MKTSTPVAGRLGLTCCVVALIASLVSIVGVGPAQAAPAPYLVAEGLEGGLAEPITIGNRMFWTSYGNSATQSQDADLWTSDGTAAGTKEFFDPNPGGDARVLEPTVFQDGFVFTADNGSDGQELWYSDGTPSGTEMVAALSEDTASTYIVGVTPSAVFLSADDGAHGQELYRWTGSGVVTLLDINPTPRTTSVEELQWDWRTQWTDSHPFELGVLGDTLILSADNTTRGAVKDEWDEWHINVTGNGRELWAVGPTGSPQLLKDITPNDGFGDPDPEASSTFSGGTTVLNGSVYFLVDGAQDGQVVPDLWRTNGTTGGTALAAHDLPVYWDNNRDGWNFDPAVVGSRILYAGWNRTTVAYDGVWATTGTGPGGRVSPAGDAGAPTTVRANAVFSLTQPGTGSEPWVSDGTSSTLLKDIRPGATGSIPFPVLTWGDHAYFGAATASGRNLFRTDGTAAGTAELFDLPNDAGAFVDGPIVFAGAQDVLYFFNSPDNDRNVGNELWAFDPNRVAANTPTVKLTAPALLAYGAAVNATVTVSGSAGTATGAVTLKEGTRTLGSTGLSGGRAVIALPKSLGVGTHKLVAYYSGDATYDAASSATVTVVVKAATKLAGKISDLAYTKKQAVRVTATLTTTPTIKASGTLTVLVDGRRKVAKALTTTNNNRLALTFAGLTKGKHKVQIMFTASPNAMNAKTGTVTITIVKP